MYAIEKCQAGCSALLCRPCQFDHLLEEWIIAGTDEFHDWTRVAISGYLYQPPPTSPQPHLLFRMVPSESSGI